MALQRYGADLLGRLYDHLCETAYTLYEMVRARADFEAIHEPESNILCFRYVGALRLPDNEERRSGQAGPALDDLNQELRERFNRAGDGWITATSLGGRRVLRVTVMNPRTTPKDLERVLDGLSAIGSAI